MKTSQPARQKRRPVARGGTFFACRVEQGMAPLTAVTSTMDDRARYDASDDPRPPALPPGHACCFARPMLREDPLVAEAVRKYDALDAQRTRLMRDGDFAGAWNALVAMKAVEKELRLHCQQRDPSQSP